MLLDQLIKIRPNGIMLFKYFREESYLSLHIKNGLIFLAYNMGIVILLPVILIILHLLITREQLIRLILIIPQIGIVLILYQMVAKVVLLLALYFLRLILSVLQHIIMKLWQAFTIQSHVKYDICLSNHNLSQLIQHILHLRLLPYLLCLW